METDQGVLMEIKKTGALSTPERATLLTSFLTKQNVWQVAQVESALTVRGSIEHGYQLNKYVALNSGRDAYKLIMMLITNTAMFFNVNGNLNSHQLVQITQVILERFGYDNLEDIVLALKDARMGYYDKVYGRIDGEVIINWVEKYMDKKAEEMEKLHHANKHKAPEMHADILKIAKEAAEKKQQYQAPPKYTVDELTWKAWFDENLDQFTVEELNDLKKQLINGSLHGANGAEISRISERLNKLEKEVAE